MTIRYRLVFSLTLTVVFAVPRMAGAQFDLDRQATEIATQVQEILNRITQYTTQITQYTSLDCSAQGMAAGVQATPVGQLPVVCDTLGMLGSFRDSYQQLLAVPADLLHTAPPLPDWRDVLQAADTVTEADIRNIYQDGADDAVGAFGRQREYADRGLVLAHAESDAVAALTDTLDEADAAVRDLEARSSVTRTGMGKPKSPRRSPARGLPLRLHRFAPARHPPRRRMPISPKPRAGNLKPAAWPNGPRLKPSGHRIAPRATPAPPNESNPCTGATGSPPSFPGTERHYL